MGKIKNRRLLALIAVFLILPCTVLPFAFAAVSVDPVVQASAFNMSLGSGLAIMSVLGFIIGTIYRVVPSASAKATALAFKEREDRTLQEREDSAAFIQGVCDEKHKGIEERFKRIQDDAKIIKE